MVAATYITLLCLIVVVVCIVFVRLESALRRHRYKPAAHVKDLPTVSVCIPARNEMHAMTECLERVLASDYPKLEIIVLDDSSVDDTSMLVKSFAHAGVRFIEGRPLPEDWLGKNNALQGLLDEASGKYVLFLDVDTTIRPESIKRLVEVVIEKDLQLASVMPQREDGLRASIFLGTLRYFWLLLRGSRRHPAVSAASWLVRRESLVSIGGFADSKFDTNPEIAIAKALGATDGQQLLISNKTLGISYEKKWSSQVETGIRLLTPLFGGTWLTVASGIMLLGIVVIPFAGLVASFVTASALGVVMALVVLCLITLVSLRFFHAAWRYGWWLGAVHWPYVVLQEAVLMFVSAIAYRLHKVTWKGRPIQTQPRQ